VLPLQSTTFTDQEFLVGGTHGKPAMVAGVLSLPRAGTEKFPVVILLHGSGGISSYVTNWEQDFLAMGVATFVDDSFSGRGIVATNTDQLQLAAESPRNRLHEGDTHGFSRGGHSALYASLKRFRRMHGPQSGVDFAAYIVFHPTCNMIYHDDANITDRPVRIFHGSADDYAPAATCRDYVERLRANGKDVPLTEYAGATQYLVTAHNGLVKRALAKTPHAHHRSATPTRSTHLSVPETPRVRRGQCPSQFSRRNFLEQLADYVFAFVKAVMRRELSPQKVRILVHFGVSNK
jgi:dienelactone hydrolase